MQRSEIYKLIDKERESQDRTWSDRSQYSRYAPHILILDKQIQKLKDLWYTSKKEDLTERMIMTAAVAVRALEEVVPDK